MVKLFKLKYLEATEHTKITITIIFLAIFSAILYIYRKYGRTHQTSHKKTHFIEIKDASKYIDQTVELKGWIQHIRKQSRKLWFIEFRDGTGIPPLLSCILYGDLCKSTKAKSLAVETSLIIHGTIKPRKIKKQQKRKHKTMKADLRTVELQISDFTIIGKSCMDITTICRKDSSPQIKLDQRHLMIRHETKSTMLKMRCFIIQAFRDFFYKKHFIEVTPPILIQSQCEGGGELFQLKKYFDEEKDSEEIYLSQTSQLYLESCLPSLKKVFSIMQSFRAEGSKTRRHLAEFTHVEAELSFIKFEELLDVLEEMVVYVCSEVVSKHGDLLKYCRKLQHEQSQWQTELKQFVIPQRPFKRMTHEEAIEFCQKHDIKKLLVDEYGKPVLDDGKEIYVSLEKGDDITEKPEREMIDMIGEPVFLIKFPAKLKSFYMCKCTGMDGKDDLTESVDLLIPGVGEIIGGSMREWDYDKLIKALKDYDIEDIEELKKERKKSKYYWYSDLRKYGSVPHGGFGLGLERFVCWMLHIYHIRDAVLYPRFIGRCTP